LSYGRTEMMRGIIPYLRGSCAR